MTSQAKDNWKTVALFSIGIVCTLVGVVFGSAFQGYQDQVIYTRLQESFRRRYVQIEDTMKENSAKHTKEHEIISAAVEKARDKAQTDRDDILSRVATIEGRMPKP